MPFAAGSRLGPYEILAPLGAGGMGEVWRAQDTRLRREVAIKVLPEEFARDPDRLRRFEREARAAGMLNHPNITAIYDVGSHEGASYVVEELLEGETLRSLLVGGPLPPRRAVEAAVQIAHGLAAAHEKGIVHRDLKPENLWVTPDGRVKILDFGLARLTSMDEASAATDLSTTPAATEPGVVLGTLCYMSPEQVRGRVADARSDIFSLGAILYEMLSGARAFRADSSAEIMSAILKEDPPDLSGARRDIPPGLERIVRHCLEKTPEARFQSARDVAFALQELSSAPPAAGQTWPAARGTRLLPALSVGAVAVFLLAILFAADVGGIRKRLLGSTTSGIRSVAVLPLENFSRDPDQEYFADGMTEALITDLAQIRSLRVISRTSVMAYKSAKKPLPQIGRELNVDGIVEGSVQKSGDRVRITAQLVQASNDRHLWARSYERDLRDVLTLQSEVARSIAEEIRAAVTPEEATRLARPRGVDPEAHELYLKGRFAWANGSESEMERAIGLFQQALAKDPGYAAAYAGLADVYYMMSDVYRAPYDVLPKAKEAAEQALKLDGTLSDAHTSLAAVHLLYDWDWARARQETSRAIDLNPSSAGAHDVRGTCLAALGRREESAAEMRRALELDPRSPLVNFDAGWALFMGRDFEQALRRFRVAAAIEPTFGWPRAGVAMSLAAAGRNAEAIPAAEEGPRVDKSPLVLAVAGGVFAKCGAAGRAQRVLAEIGEISKRHYVCPYEIAIIHVGLGDREQAFRFLEQGLRDRSTCMPFAKVDARLDPIRSDPRFARLLREIGFPP